MADLMFDAATSAAADAQDEQEKPSHVFSAIPYERALSIADRKRLGKSEQRLHDRLDQIMHVWVRDARSFRHGRPSDIPPFSLRLHLSLPIAELRDMVQEQFTYLSAYNEATDGALHLVHNGRVLENGSQLAEYVVPPEPSRSSPLEKRAAGHTQWP